MQLFGYQSALVFNCQVIRGFFNFCPNLKKALAINRVKMVTTQTVSSFFFVLFEFKYFFLMQHVFSGWKPLQETKHKIQHSIKYTNNSACKLPQNSNTKAHFCNRLPDNIKHCLTSSIPGSGQQVKSPISSHHMLSKHSHYLCLSDLTSCISCHEDHFLLHNKSCIFKTKVPSRLQSDSTTVDMQGCVLLHLPSPKVHNHLLCLADVERKRLLSWHHVVRVATSSL